jgi:Ras-related GTP-binding protein C/D
VLRQRPRDRALLTVVITRYLALICLMGDDSPAEKKAVIDYNVGVFQAALKQVFPRSDRDTSVPEE